MFKDSYTVLGIMSGTSLDGIDLAYIHFEYTTSWQFNILHGETIPYSLEWITILKNAVHQTDEDLINLNVLYTNYLAKIINVFISKHPLINIDFVSSHGHTIKHEPQNNYTLQIGNLPQLAALVKQTVVCDFRVQDVALGGQGAPLVPIGDALLFPEYDYCLNLGGFSNISFDNKGERIAYDISAVNTVLNWYANKLGFDYDDKGNNAKSGHLNEKLFNALNELSYYKMSFPKSLGVEFVFQQLLPLIDSFTQDETEILHTFTEHIAFQIAKVIDKQNAKILISGGGAYNVYLISRIQFYLPKCTLVIPKNSIIEFKEALIFAFLGVLKIRNEVNVLSTVTGASRNHSSGKVYVFNS